VRTHPSARVGLFFLISAAGHISLASRFEFAADACLTPQDLLAGEQAAGSWGLRMF